MSFLRLNVTPQISPPTPRILHEETRHHVLYRPADLPLTTHQTMVTLSRDDLWLTAHLAKRWRGTDRPGLSALSVEDFSFATLAMAEREIRQAVEAGAVQTPRELAEVRLILATLQRVTGVAW